MARKLSRDDVAYNYKRVFREFFGYEPYEVQKTHNGKLDVLFDDGKKRYTVLELALATRMMEALKDEVF